MQPDQIHNLDHLQKRRKNLRNQLTPAEAKLWSMLKGAQFRSYKFRRQHSIENYIVDFYCPAHQLIVELDGDVHNNPGTAMHDSERDAKLIHLGFKIVRFENRLVFENIEYVLSSIEAACTGR